MLYLAIDQHRKQLTVNLRNEQGDVVLKRQVSTEWPRVRSFLDEVRKMSASEGGFVAILEVCGFNDWLLKLLAEYGCRETMLIQPEKRSKKKTDRRDANRLGRTSCGSIVSGCWRARRSRGSAVCSCRPSRRPQDRQITALRNGWGNTARGRSTRSNICCGNTTWNRSVRPRGWIRQRTRKWLATLPLDPIDRLEMDQLLAQWKLWDEQLERLEVEIEKRQAENATAAVLATIPGCGGLRQLGVGIADRFDRAISAAGEFGELLGPDARMPQLGRSNRSTRLDHQTRQRHGAIHPWANGPARLAA